MSEHAILNNIDHADLGYNKANFDHAEYKSMCSPILIEEIDTLQCEYPIFFLDCKEGMQVVVLCGFKQGENLYLQNGEWQAAFRPLYTKKGPFFISFNSESNKAAIAVDLQDSRVSNEFIPKLFTDKGGNSTELNEVKEVLEQLGEGLQKAKAFVQLLEKYDLLEPFNLEVSFSSNDSSNVSGLYTINEENLFNLSDEAILEFHKNGAMKKIYLILGSINNVRKLINKKLKVLGSK